MAPRPAAETLPMTLPLYPNGCRVRAANDAGEVEHRDAVVIARRWIDKDVLARIHSAARGSSVRLSPYATWLYLLDVSKGRWYAERRLTPIVGGDDTERVAEARPVQIPA